MSNCPPSYKNLNKIQSFSDQRNVTVQLLEQICSNDEYLKQYCDKLEYLTPPAVRKRYSPVPVDESKSWGYAINSDNQVCFDSSRDISIPIDFSDESVIDKFKSTIFLDSKIVNGNIEKKIVIPKITEDNIDGSTRVWSPWTNYDSTGKPISGDMNCNEFWYVGYNKTGNYETRPDWLKNIYDSEIPSVCRAQTFKPKVNGLLETVVLNIRRRGNNYSDTGSPLIVQIRKTVNQNGILYPHTSPDSDGTLATAEVTFTNSDPGITSITFDHPCYVSKNETYAIVVMSPLSHSSNCYAVGGWSKKCHADPYTEGNAFLSEKNGRDWMLYGKGDNVPYHEGKNAPVDFCFQCYINQPVNKTETGEHWFYLNPIYSNPIREVRLTVDYWKDGHNTIEWFVSQTGYDDDWIPLGSNLRQIFENPSKVLFIKARMQSMSNSEASPQINNLTIDLFTDSPREMYVRTHPTTPKLSPMLGANIWGRLNAPFLTEPDTECSAEIILSNESYEHFKIIELTDLQYYTHIEGIDESKIIGKSEKDLVNYLTENILNLFKENNIYIKGYYDDEDEWVDLLGEIQLQNSPAAPIITVYLQPEDTTLIGRYFGEWYDFIMNYSKDTLKFNDELLEDLPAGVLKVTYNELFIDGLTNEEMPLILDYFKQDFIITEENLETRSVPLRVSPVDPVRSVLLNEVELVEDKDYFVDYQNNLLCFPVIDETNNSTVLKVNDNLSVVYTPNLEDPSICIGYHAKRSDDTVNQVYIEPNYIEYK